jgi:class 3 adenylate cyclase/tetratricopeptide (TPR) repeat protein
MAESQTVAVLFTDMVGSTALSSQLDRQAGDLLRQGHFSLLRQALASTGGTEVKNLGDGLMAVFPGATAAVACAVVMQQGVEQANRRDSYEIGLRVGVSCGEATEEDGDYFGDPVVEAARVCALCDGGGVLITDAVKAMLGRRNTHPLTEEGEHELKGLPDPVGLWSVGWVPAPIDAGIPLPERLKRSTGLFGFVGRSEERERLLHAVKNQEQEGGRIIFISGEPGIGKSSLCRAVASDVHERGVVALYGRCDEDLGLPYQPFAEALSHLLINADDAILQAHVANHGGALFGLVPALGRRLPDVTETHGADPNDERYRLFRAVVELLTLASQDVGLLLVLDDLHWADNATLQLLRHFDASASSANVTVLATYRDSELSAGDALSDTLASIGRDSTSERIDLVGLNEVEIIEMMEVVAGHEMDEDGVSLAHAMRQETEGNPFFTTQLLRHLGETGLVHQDETGRWVASQDLYQKGLPQSVRQVVGQRVDRLGEEVRRVLSLAAVIGREFEIEVLSAVAELDEERVLDLLDGAIEAGLVVELKGAVGRFSFAHALTQHTLYEDLGVTRRARVHRRVADALEGVCGDAPESRAGELAKHYLAATKTADVMKALGYSKMAGDQALTQLAPADAVVWYGKAIELLTQAPTDDGLRCDVLIGLGTAQRQLGDPSHRQTLLQAAALAQEADDTERLVAAALANSRGGASSSGEVDAERVAVLERAIVMVGETDSPERALLLATLSGELTYDDPDRRDAVREEALSMARRLGDSLTLAQATLDVYYSGYTLVDLEVARSDVQQVLDVAVAAGDSLAVFKAHQLLATLALEFGDRTKLDEHLDQAAVLAERLDLPYQRWSVTMLRSTCALLDCEFDRAEALAQEALAIGSESFPEAMATFGAQAEAIARLRGDSDGMEAIAQLFGEVERENPGLPVLRAGLARLYCDLERVGEAQLLLAGDIDSRFMGFQPDVTWVSAMAVLADIILRLEDRDAAQVLYDRLLPHRDQVATVQASVDGPIALHLGELASVLDIPEAEQHFARALELSRQLRAPYWIARTQLSWAQMLLKEGTEAGAARASSMRSEAAELVRRHGMGDVHVRL